MSGLAWLNALPEAEAAAELSRCCGTRAWVDGMVRARPFADAAAAHRAAEELWARMDNDQVREAFKHHPRIGDLDNLKKRFATTASWSRSEQDGVASAREEVLQALAKANRDYETRFGHLFLICATGKTAEEMLTALLERLTNMPAHELKIAAAEQAKITRLRLEKLLSP